MEKLKFDKETAEGLYRIFCGLNSSCYQNAEVYDEAKPNLKTKTSILAATKAFFILLVMCCFISCSLKNVNKFEKYDVIVIDSCEYIQWGCI
jgi:hypothetical protein